MACLIVGVCGIRILPQKTKGCEKYFSVRLHNEKEVKYKGQLPPLPTTTDYNEYRPCQQKYTKNTTVPSIVVCGVNFLCPKTGCDIHILHWRIKKISGDRQTQPLNSTTRLKIQQKQIQKHRRNTTIPVYIVSFVSVKNNKQK